MLLELVFEGGGWDDMENECERDRSLCQKIAAHNRNLQLLHRDVIKRMSTHLSLRSSTNHSS